MECKLNAALCSHRQFATASRLKDTGIRSGSLNEKAMAKGAEEKKKKANVAAAEGVAVDVQCTCRRCRSHHPHAARVCMRFEFGSHLKWNMNSMWHEHYFASLRCSPPSVHSHTISESAPHKFAVRLNSLWKYRSRSCQRTVHATDGIVKYNNSNKPRAEEQSSNERTNVTERMTINFKLLHVRRD